MDGLPCKLSKCLDAFNTDQAGNVFGAGPPQDGALDQAASEHPEVLAQQFRSCPIAHAGEAQCQIDGAHLAASGGNQVKQGTQGSADPHQHAKRAGNAKAIK